jgi:hypothetical protein
MRPGIRPGLIPSVPLSDALDWIIVKAEHLLGDAGFITQLELEHRDNKEAPESDV